MSGPQMLGAAAAAMSGAAERLRHEAVVAERVRQRTMTSRRRRLARSAAIFVVLTAGMVLVSLAHRDAQEKAQCRQRADYIASELSKKYRNRKLPLLLPHREEDRDWVLQHYNYRLLNDRYFGQSSDVGICCCRTPHRLSLQEAGRYVVVFDGDDYRVRWMTESEFRKQAASLHLPITDD